MFAHLLWSCNISAPGCAAEMLFFCSSYSNNLDICSQACCLAQLKFCMFPLNMSKPVFWSLFLLHCMHLDHSQNQAKRCKSERLWLPLIVALILSDWSLAWRTCTSSTRDVEMMRPLNHVNGNNHNMSSSFLSLTLWTLDDAETVYLLQRFKEKHVGL